MISNCHITFPEKGDFFLYTFAIDSYTHLVPSYKQIWRMRHLHARSLVLNHPISFPCKGSQVCTTTYMYPPASQKWMRRRDNVSNRDIADQMPSSQYDHNPPQLLWKAKIGTVNDLKVGIADSGTVNIIIVLCSAYFLFVAFVCSCMTKENILWQVLVGGNP